MNGKITKGIAGFYYVHVPELGVVECKARGIFRNKKIKPLIGDNVEIEVVDEEQLKGNIVSINKRINQLIRPTVANINQAVIVFSVDNPSPNFNLLDRFIVMTEKENIKSIVCFNKIDLDLEKAKEYKEIYLKAGYDVYLTSTKQNIGVDKLIKALNDRTTVFAGPSGVGKSSLLNKFQTDIILETGAVSEKIKRGKHTTRHAELISFNKDSYVVDTPGFSSLSINDIKEEDLKNYFIEFNNYEANCRFNGCNHLSEPDCCVKKAVKDNEIADSRYNSYSVLYEELKNIRRW
jgi:ribosome biogenesis GTPase